MTLADLRRQTEAVLRADPPHAHLEFCVDLALTHAVSVVRSPDAEWWARTRRRIVEAHPIVSDADVASYLHEVGHCIDVDFDRHRRETFTNARGVAASLAAEIAAWRIAVDLAGRRWNARMQNCLEESLNVYVDYTWRSRQRSLAPEHRRSIEALHAHGRDKARGIVRVRRIDGNRTQLSSSQAR